MTAPSAGGPLTLVVRALEAVGIPYMVSGSFASSLHGIPRSTHDVDLVIDPSAEQLDAFLGRLASEAVYVDPPSARDALRRRDQFNLIDLAHGWKIDLIVRKDRAFSREELSRRVRGTVAGVEVDVATPEDTILAKLEWCSMSRSERQLDDVRGILATRGETLDRPYLDRWARALGVADLWASLANPPR